MLVAPFAAARLLAFFLLLALGIVYAQLHVLGCLAHLHLGREDYFWRLERFDAHVDFVVNHLRWNDDAERAEVCPLRFPMLSFLDLTSNSIIVVFCLFDS